jgi:hypothetical protein
MIQSKFSDRYSPYPVKTPHVAIEHPLVHSPLDNGIINAIKRVGSRPLEHAPTHSIGDSLLLHEIGGRMCAASGSVASVVGPPNAEVVSPPDSKLLGDPKSNQNGGEISVAIQVDSGQLVAALREGRTGRDLLDLRPGNGFFARGSVVPAVSRDLEFAPLLIALSVTAKARTKEVKSETRARGMRSHTNLSDVSGAGGCGVGQGRWNKLHELATRGRNVGLGLF